MSDLLISVAITVIKGVVFLYDIVTYIPRYVIEQPYKKLALSNRLRVGTLHLIGVYEFQVHLLCLPYRVDELSIAVCICLSVMTLSVMYLRFSLSVLIRRHKKYLLPKVCKIPD